VDRVRRSREFGLRGLGQPLKSFRDSVVPFPVYQGGSRAYLDTLGPLARPERGSRAGIPGPNLELPAGVVRDPEDRPGEY